MAESTADLQSLIRSNFCSLDFDPNTELMTQFCPHIINRVTDNSSLLSFQSFNIVPFSSDNLFGNNPAPDQIFPGNLAENFPGKLSSTNIQNQPFASKCSSLDAQPSSDESHESKKRKAALNLDASDNSSGVTSPFSSQTGNRKKNDSGKAKRVKSNNEKEKDESPEEVVHVRARRGQATSNHSLAERARRGKINERLRCLQAIVPGCYKTMGIAVMLDEIINYVQSLQNQVEFLSMMLTTASTFHDFNSETDAMERVQIDRVNEAKETELGPTRDGLYGGFPQFY